MTKKITSSNSDKDPYRKGYVFWSTNQFWNTGMYSEKSREYFNDSLNRMQQNERVLSRVDSSI